MPQAMRRQGSRWRGVQLAGCALAVLALMQLAPLAGGQGKPIRRAGLNRFMGNVTYDLEADMLPYCDTLGPLYDGIVADLRLWSGGGAPPASPPSPSAASADSTNLTDGGSGGGSGSPTSGSTSGRNSSGRSGRSDPPRAAGAGADGISREALALAATKYTTRGGQKGVALAFYGGRAYVIHHKPKLGGLGHHVNILFTYMLVMLDLQRQFGALIPDVEFVIASSDRPMVLTAEQEVGLVPPVMRFCSSDDHADIKIPIFHFYTKKYSHALLAHVPDVNAQYAWANKSEVVFGRFSKYYRHVHPAAASTLRRGAGGRSICRLESTKTMSCTVRAHVMEWAAAFNDTLDIKSGPRVSWSKHASFKYLVHIDGQALSSRLEQLLPLNSLVLKEESGYKTFYHHLLRPYEHYVPVWVKGPEEILEARQWALGHDAEARAMAQAGQDLAVKYLGKKARSCYWLRLLQAYAALQRFTPDPGFHAYAVPVEDYLEGEGRAFEGGKHIHKIEF